MFNYIAFLHSGIASPSDRPIADGKLLAEKCLDQLNALENHEQFPPRLLILLTSPAYIEQPKAAQLIAGIHQAFAKAGFNEIPLIGSSVAAVFFEREIHEKGALLLCFASRMLKALVSVGPNVSKNEESAISALLRGLNLESADKDPNPYANRMLLAFFPGSKGWDVSKKREIPPVQFSHKLHKMLWKAVMHRIPLMGGVSSAGYANTEQPRLQFVGRQVYTDALAVARIESGTPLGTSLSKGLKRVERYLRIKKISDDKTAIESFYEGTPQEVFKGEKDVILLNELQGDTVIARPVSFPNYSSVELLHHSVEHTVLEVCIPSRRMMLEQAADSINHSMRRIHIERAIGCFSIKCASHLRYRDVLGLQIERGITHIEELLDAPYVGGFFDGEAGTNETGFSVMGNWNVSTMVIGDELRERTYLQEAFSAMAELGPKLTEAASLEEAIRLSLQLVFDAGFPGAMISLLFRNQGNDCIVAQAGEGHRFNKVVGMTQRPLSGLDILAFVAQEKEPSYIRDSRTDQRCDPYTVQVSGIISQYIIPLMVQGENDQDHDVFATLQIDLGNASYKEYLLPTEKKVLDSLGATIGAAIGRILGWEEVRIARELDRTLNTSLSATRLEDGLQHFTKAAVEIFEADMGHVRLANHERGVLYLAAGVGPYYEAARESRKEIAFGDKSPTSESFQTGEIILANYANENTAHQTQFRRYSASAPLSQTDAPILEALKAVGSYVNITFKSEKNEKIGTINIVSRRPWYFNWAHVRSMEGLGQRIGFLVEHLRRKVAEELTSAELQTERNRLKFLFASGPDLSHTAIFDDAPKALADATARFREAAGAEVASLYLWDKETKKFVLRAHDKWMRPEWVNAARYGERDGWTGTVALDDRPRYVSDLREYKRKTAHDGSGRWVTQMFGSALPDDLTLEAIGLPLKVGNDVSGVLTLHRRINRNNSGKITRFTTTELRDLQEAAAGMSAFVSALMSYQKNLWEKKEQERREAVLGSLIQGNDTNIENKICHQLVKSFQALRATLYIVEPNLAGLNRSNVIKWKAGYDRSLRKSPEPTEPDQLIQDAASSKQVQVSRCPLGEREQDIPKIVALEGLVERACVPLLVEKQLYGIVDLRWRLNYQYASRLMFKHSSEHLQILGFMLASAYHRHVMMAKQQEARLREERSRRYIRALDGLFSLSGHKTEELLKGLTSLCNEIKSEKNEDRRKQKIDRLVSTAETHSERIYSLRDAAKKVISFLPRPHSLLGLIDDVLNELAIDEARPDILVLRAGLEGRTIFATKEAIREVFINIINNAVDAIAGVGVLTIKASLVQQGKAVRIEFTDTGKGMSEEEIELAMEGDTGSPRHMGVGVLISRKLVEAQDGKFNIKSTIGTGTNVIVILPTSQTEEA